MRPFVFWAPIAYLEVEGPFEFGSVQVAPITGAMIDELEAKGVGFSPNQRDSVVAMFKDLRQRMQGFAAVVVHVEAEPVRAYEDGIAIAQNVVGLLRFFSPAARESRLVCSTALLGAEVIPRSQALVLSEDHFSFTEGLVSAPFAWRLSKENVSTLWGAGLAKASSLISPNGLSELPLAVRASVLLYGTSTTLHNPADRLIYALSAVEGILLKHSMEPTEFNMEERMSLLLASGKPERAAVARNVREAYRFRRRHGASVLTPHDENSLATFAHNAHVVLCIALENLHLFATKADFIEAVDRRKTTIPD